MTQEAQPATTTDKVADAPRRPPFRPAKRRSARRIVASVPLLPAVGGGVAYRLRPKAVTTTHATRGTAIDAVYAIATVEARDRVTVKAKVPGSVLDLRVREGDVVKKGDLLATIDSPAIKFQLQRGKADQWAASQQASSSSPQLAVVEAQARMTEATLKNAKDELGRLQQLTATGATPAAELDRAKSNVLVLEAQLASQRAQSRALRIDLTAKASGSSAVLSELTAKVADAEVRAPIDGVVLARTVEPGELVPQNGPLFKIGDVKTLVLECMVDEADIGRLDVGKKAAVSLYAFPKQVFRGEVIEILPDADRAKKSFLVKVRVVDAPSAMRSGMSAEVNIIVDEHAGALLAPTEALDANGSVWVIRGGRAAKQAIVTGVRDMLNVEVLSGLNDGDEIVVLGMADLVVDARVKATHKDPDSLSAAPRAPARGGGSL